MNEEEFINICKDNKFWKWVNNKSIVPYPKIEDRENFLKILYKQISKRTYYPKPPNDYLTLNKEHGVLRVIPILNLSDLIVFYYCTRKLENYIAVNHVPGTYGGFGLSGKLRRVEEQEIKDITSGIDVVNFNGEEYVFEDQEGYPTQSSFNPKAWQAEWDDFTNKLYHNSYNFEDNLQGGGFVVEIDIANFYDTIQLDNLEYKIRKFISNEENNTVYLLMHFLRYWNRHINFYRQQGAGVPQDLFGECSRILANFYLQEYDKKMFKYCNDIDCNYFRYADDQVIFLDSKEKKRRNYNKSFKFFNERGSKF